MAIQSFFTADRTGKGLCRHFLLPFQNRLPVFVNIIVDRFARGRRHTGLVVADEECFLRFPGKMLHQISCFAEGAFFHCVTGELMRFCVRDVPVNGIVNSLPECFHRPFPCRDLRQGEFHLRRGVRFRKGHVHIINELEAQFCGHQFLFYLLSKFFQMLALKLYNWMASLLLLHVILHFFLLLN